MMETIWEDVKFNVERKINPYFLASWLSLVVNNDDVLNIIIKNDNKQTGN